VFTPEQFSLKKLKSLALSNHPLQGFALILQFSRRFDHVKRLISVQTTWLLKISIHAKQNFVLWVLHLCVLTSASGETDLQPFQMLFYDGLFLTKDEYCQIVFDVFDFF